MFSGQSFLHILSVVLGSGPDRTTSHFLMQTTLISFLAYYTDCSLTKLFLFSRSLHYYFFTSILHFINIYCSRVAVCRSIVLSIKRIYISSERHRESSRVRRRGRQRGKEGKRRRCTQRVTQREYDRGRARDGGKLRGRDRD